MKRTLFFSITTVLVFTLGLLNQSCSESKINKTDLEGYWSLKSLNGQPAAEAFKGNTPSIEFDFEEMKISGTGGCNRYFGPFTLEENILKPGNIASTNMMCLEENKEPEFLATLTGEKGLKLALNNGGILQFKDNDKIVLEFEKAEAPKESTGITAVSMENLTGSWSLSQINGEDSSSLFGDKPATMIIQKDGSVTGNAGCNNYRTNMSLEGSTISFTVLASTRMACPNLEGEQTFTQILSEPLQGTINGNVLKLLQKGEIVLEFTKNEQ